MRFAAGLLGKPFVLDKKNKPEEEEPLSYFPLILLFPMTDVTLKVLAQIFFYEMTGENEKLM